MKGEEESKIEAEDCAEIADACRVGVEVKEEARFGHVGRVDGEAEQEYPPSDIDGELEIWPIISSSSASSLSASVISTSPEPPNTSPFFLGDWSSWYS